ncbi:hypothetical protein AKJ50_02495, partial [candidate division MSBL1 archaeon SCGC-AAA382A13]
IASSLKPYLTGDRRIKINTHTDPDGISAGVILAKCLKHYDTPFHVSFGGPPEKKDLENLKKQDYDLFIFLDQGTGQFQIIKKHLLDKNCPVMILDHHPGDVKNQTGLDYLNPHIFNLSGAKDVSASGVTYSVIEKINPKFEKLSEIALIGALGDRQDTPSGLTGINKKILQKSIEKNIMTTKTGLKLYGRSLKIHECLSNSIKPFLLGISGNESEAKNLVKKTGFSNEKTLENLSNSEEKKLRKKILEKIKIDAPENLKNSLWGTIYTSKTNQTAGPKNAHEYVTLLDSCEKFRKIEIGFSSLLGDEKSGEKALEIVEKYQNLIIETMNQIASNKEKIKTTSHLRYLDFGDDVKSKIVGEILSIAIESGLIKTDKPIFGLSKAGEDRLKISARATPEYVESGPALGKVLKKVSEELGGSGGGHNVAAAARIPLERKSEFIKKTNKLIQKK